MDSAPKIWTATILDKRNLTGSIWLFRFRLDDPTFSFTPGQYGTVVIDEKTRRQYSFASSPASLPEGEFIVDTTPMGKGSLFFLNADPGMKFQMLAPLGNFYVNESPGKKVLVATGTGIAPFRSMLRHAVNSVRVSQYSLYWGLRYEDDIYWQDEMKAITGQLTGFQFFLCLSKPGETWSGISGHVTETVLANETSDAGVEFYLCGNKKMVEELSRSLKNRGIGENSIKTDVYF